MHEMGIVSSVLETVQRELRKHAASRAIKVGLRIGEFAGVDSESLRFCFEALTKRTEFEGLALEIERTGADDLAIAFIELDDVKELSYGSYCG
jgi:hydrogenase nickel incorporation protein HypA/HybF